MKVLFLTPQLPYPANSGGRIKSFKMIEYLGQNYDLDLGYLVKKDQVSIVSEFMGKVKISKSFSRIVDRPRSFKNFCMSLLKNIPLSVYRNYDSEFKTKISKTNSRTKSRS